MVRILVVTPWFPTTDAPASGLFVAREVDALAEAHEVRVLHLDWNSAAADRTSLPSQARVDRIRLRRGSLRDYRRARRLVDTAAADSDVVHTHSLTLLLPWLWKRVTAKPWVHSEHWSGLTSPGSLGLGERVALALLAPGLSRPDAVVVESSRLRAAVAAHRAGSISLVPCIVPESPVVDAPRGADLRLLGIGGLIPRKGPLLAVAAVASLERRGIDARLTWVGDGPQRAEVEATAAQLGVGDRIHLTGVLPEAEVSDALDAADMLLLPTQGDNFCVVAAEALVHGRPIVSGVATGAVDYADPSVSRFVAAQSANAYADAVLDLRAATIEASAGDIAQTVAGRFTPARVRDLLAEVYRGADTA